MKNVPSFIRPTSLLPFAILNANRAAGYLAVLGRISTHSSGLYLAAETQYANNAKKIYGLTQMIF